MYIFVSEDIAQYSSAEKMSITGMCEDANPGMSHFKFQKLIVTKFTVGRTCWYGALVRVHVPQDASFTHHHQDVVYTAVLSGQDFYKKGKALSTIMENIMAEVAVVQQTKTYGGKSGVWLLAKKQKRQSAAAASSSSTRTTMTMRATLPTGTCCTSIRASASTTAGIYSSNQATRKEYEDQILKNYNECNSSKKGVSLSPKTSSSSIVAMTKQRQQRLLLRHRLSLQIKGSHFGLVIPKKFLLLQQSKLLPLLNQQRLQEHVSSSSSFPNRQHPLSMTAVSPKVRLIGWDSVKCRPIYYKNQCSSSLRDDHCREEDEGRLYLDRQQQQDLREVVDDDQQIYLDGVNDITINNNEEGEEEDTDMLWKMILDQKLAKTYGGRRRRDGRCGGDGRKMKTLSSVLERLASPSLNHHYMHENKSIRQRSSSSSRKILFQSTYPSINEKIQQQKQEQQCPLSDITNNILNTPNTKSNRCQIKPWNSDISNNNIMMSSFMSTAVTTTTLEGRKILKKRKTASPCTLHFQDDIHDATAAIVAPALYHGNIGKNSKEVHASNNYNIVSAAKMKIFKNKQQQQLEDYNIHPKSKRQKHQKKMRGGKWNDNIKIGGRNKSISHNYSDNYGKRNRDVTSSIVSTTSTIKQISSKTSLSVAKAFFEKLDRYELTIR